MINHNFRRHILFLCSIGYGWVCSNTTANAQNLQPSAMREISKIVIDLGHGGENTGCMGLHGVFEKHLTLQIAKQVAELLKQKTGLDAILTRTEDTFVDLRQRTRIAAGHHADVFVSIHLNASPKPDAKGVEVYFLSLESSSEEIAALVKRENWEPPLGVESAQIQQHELSSLLLSKKLDAAHRLSELLATHLYDSLVKATGFVGRGVKQAPFAVLKEAAFPAVVVECGFLTHEEEGFELLESRRINEIAAAIVDGLMAFDNLLTPPAPLVEPRLPPR
ncbi:MAG: N-acetylmuramoyl-L-alanine amidase [Myxococcales bacterium]|nr:N-acetylmuramoyl-L-alanine amidase [Myxococcales bacterium]